MRGNDWSYDSAVNGARWAMCVLDFCYIFLMTYQRTKFGSYPSTRYTKGWYPTLSIWSHIIGGSLTIFGGSIVFLVVKVDEGRIVDPDWSNFFDTMSWIIACGVALHIFSCFELTPQVYGERMITFPLYVSASCMNFVQMIYLFRYIGNYNYIMNSWATMNIFIYVRFIFMTLCWIRGINFHLLYTYTIAISTLPTVFATGGNAWFILFYASPVVFAVIYKFAGWQFLEEHGLAMLHTPADIGIDPLNFNVQEFIDGRRLAKAMKEAAQIKEMQKLNPPGTDEDGLARAPFDPQNALIAIFQQQRRLRIIKRLVHDKLLRMRARLAAEEAAMEQSFHGGILSSPRNDYAGTPRSIAYGATPRNAPMTSRPAPLTTQDSVSRLNRQYPLPQMSHRMVNTMGNTMGNTMSKSRMGSTWQMSRTGNTMQISRTALMEQMRRMASKSNLAYSPRGSGARASVFPSLVEPLSTRGTGVHPELTPGEMMAAVQYAK